MANGDDYGDYGYYDEEDETEQQPPVKEPAKTPNDKKTSKEPLQE